MQPSPNLPPIPARFEVRHLSSVAMQGILAGTAGDRNPPTPEAVAKLAVDYAEALIKELDSRKPFG
jgi:hypothetical protein